MRAPDGRLPIVCVQIGLELLGQALEFLDEQPQQPQEMGAIMAEQPGDAAIVDPGNGREIVMGGWIARGGGRWR